MADDIIPEEDMVAFKYKAKEFVRLQHRKVILIQLIWTVIWMGLLNFFLMWGYLHSTFPKDVIGVTSDRAFFTGFVVLPNIAWALFPLLYYTSNRYRAKVPDRIKRGVETMMEQSATDSSTDTGKIISGEIDNLAY